MTDDVVDIIMLIILAAAVKKCMAKRPRHRRRWWVRPVNKQRRKHGYFATLIKIMKEEDQEEFFTFTRMTLNVFEKLLGLVGSHLEKKKTRDILCSEERLLITL